MTHILHASLAALLLAAAAPADPAPRADDRPPPASRPAPRPTRADLERRLDELRDETERIERALQNLDAPDDHANPAIPEPRPRFEPGQRRPDQPRPGDLPRPGPRDQRDPPDTTALMDLLREHNPAFHQRLERLLQERPMVGQRMARELAGRLPDLRRAQERDPAALKIQLDVMRVEWDMREAAFNYLRQRREGDPDHARQALRETLTRLADERFGLMLDERAHHVGQLSQRLERLRAELASSAERRHDFVRRRVDEMIDRLDRQGAPGHDQPPDRD